MKKRMEWPNAPQVLKDLHARLLAAHILSTLDSKLVPAMLQEILDNYWDSVIEAMTSPDAGPLNKVDLEFAARKEKRVKAGLSAERPNREGTGIWKGNFCRRNKEQRVRAILDSLSSTNRVGANGSSFVWMSAGAVARDIRAPKRKVEFILSKLGSYRHADGSLLIKKNSARYGKGIRVVHQFMLNHVASSFCIDKTMEELVERGLA